MKTKDLIVVSLFIALGSASFLLGLSLFIENKELVREYSILNEKLYPIKKDGEFSFATSSDLQFGEDSYQINRGYGEGNFLSEDYLVQTGEFSKDFDRSYFGYPQNTQWYIEAGNKCDLVMQNLGSKKYGFYCK